LSISLFLLFDRGLGNVEPIPIPSRIGYPILGSVFSCIQAVSQECPFSDYRPGFFPGVPPPSQSAYPPIAALSYSNHPAKPDDSVARSVGSTFLLEVFFPLPISASPSPARFFYTYLPFFLPGLHGAGKLQAIAGLYVFFHGRIVVFFGKSDLSWSQSENP